MGFPKELLPSQQNSYHVLLAGNHVWGMHDIPHPRQVVHNALSTLGHMDKLWEGAAALVLTSQISHNLHRGETIVINDGSHANVTLLKQAPHAIEVVTVDRFGQQQRGIRIISNPHVEARFVEGKRMTEFQLAISGSTIGKRDRRTREETIISSDGDISPRAFTIATADKLLLARVDGQGTLDCSYEYQGGAKWVMNGELAVL